VKRVSAADFDCDAVVSGWFPSKPGQTSQNILAMFLNYQATCLQTESIA
jgi:hypothetical protein